MHVILATVCFIFSSFAAAKLNEASLKTYVHKKTKTTYSYIYYDKPIDLTKVKAYAQMNESELLGVARKSGISVFNYLTPKAKKLGLSLNEEFEKLPAAPPRFKIYNGPWAGMFIPIYRADINVGTHIIFLRQYFAQIGTLFHEMIHYLFEEARDTLKLQQSLAFIWYDTNEVYFMYLKQFKEGGNMFINRTHEDATLDSLARYVEVQYDSIRNFALEEVANCKLNVEFLKRDQYTYAFNSFEGAIKSINKMVTAIEDVYPYIDDKIRKRHPKEMKTIDSYRQKYLTLKKTVEADTAELRKQKEQDKTTKFEVPIE